MNGQHVYVSYSRRADYSFIKELILASYDHNYCTATVQNNSLALEENLVDYPTDNNQFDRFDVVYDENGLDPGGSISSFMEKLSEGQKIVFLLSKGYFKSPFCMHELLAIYNKRAGTLQPVVAFVDGFMPGADLKLKSITHWREEKDRLPTDAEKNKCQEFIDLIPCTLAWLLGKYDETTASWDIKNIKSSDLDACDRVFEALVKPYSPRYLFISSAQKENIISDEIEKIISKSALRKHIQPLIEVLSLAGPKGLIEKLAKIENSEQLFDVLYSIIDWMEKLTDQQLSSLEKSDIVVGVKGLVGWLLLNSVDDEKLHILVHEMNHLQDDAHLKLVRENDVVFQIIVSALVGLQVRFDLQMKVESGTFLKGQGELTTLECGVAKKNVLQSIEKDQQWSQIVDVPLYADLHLIRHGSSAAEEAHSDDKSRSEAVKHLLEYQNRKKGVGVYLDIGQKLTQTDHSFFFRQELNKRYPQITQVLSNTPGKSEDGAKRFEEYCLSGLSTGGLREVINEFYHTVDRLIHEI